MKYSVKVFASKVCGKEIHVYVYKEQSIYKNFDKSKVRSNFRLETHEMFLIKKIEGRAVKIWKTKIDFVCLLNMIQDIQRQPST